MAGLDIHNVKTWAEIELWCAANGKDVSFDLCLAFFLGAFFSVKVYDMLVHTIQDTDGLDSFFSSPSAAESVYSLALNAYSTKSRYSCYMIWTSICSASLDEDANEWTASVSALRCSDLGSINESAFDMRIPLFTAIDIKFPLLWPNLFDKHRSFIVKNDIKFVKFLL